MKSGFFVMKEFKMSEDCIAITGLKGSVFRIS